MTLESSFTQTLRGSPVTSWFLSLQCPRFSLRKEATRLTSLTGRWQPSCTAVETSTSGPRCAATPAKALLRSWWTSAKDPTPTDRSSLSCQVRRPLCFLNVPLYPAALYLKYVNHASPGETEKPCVVSLMDDSVHEEDEEFRLVLGTPKSKSQYGASIGEQKEALVTVTDVKDSTCQITNSNNTRIGHLYILETVRMFFHFFTR